MLRIVLTAMFVLFASCAQATGPCDGCEVAEEAARRSVGKPGSPESDVVCVYVSMPNQCDSIAIEADGAGFTNKQIRAYPVGAAVAMVSQRQFTRGKDGTPACKGGERAMVCVSRSALQSVSVLRLIPGNKGTCNEISGADLATLLRVGTVPASDPARLGWPVSSIKR
jgi:hypothetical protein